jgi:5-methylthioadenosine/S-adenosylhomocysteine deaminase
MVSPRLIAVHAVHLSDVEIALLARNGASVVHCPSSNLKLGSGIARVRDLLAAGVNVAIGTDGAASNNRLDTLADGRLASLLAKGSTGDARAMPAVQTLECLTLHGARALGLDARIGSIEVGKEADLVAIDLQAPETQPVFDPISQVIYAAGREHVTDVWIAGNRVVQKRQIIVQDGNVPSSTICSLAAPWQNLTQQFLNKPDV